MATRSRRSRSEPRRVDETEAARRAAALLDPAPVAGVPGPGRWLVAEFEPVSLFSLKTSSATSSVGQTLVVPTPYAIKMALVDAGFRANLSKEDCAALLKTLAKVELRIAPASSILVTHTIVRVRQQSRNAERQSPYISAVAYREVAHMDGSMRWAFDLAGGDDSFAQRLVCLLPHVNYIGKRGSFVRFVRCCRVADLGAEFTQPVERQGGWTPPEHAHIVQLDDFGPDADLEILSSFTPNKPKRDRHRRFVETIVPVGIVNIGPGFRQYSR